MAQPENSKFVRVVIGKTSFWTLYCPKANQGRIRRETRIRRTQIPPTRHRDRRDHRPDRRRGRRVLPRVLHAHHASHQSLGVAAGQIAVAVAEPEVVVGVVAELVGDQAALKTGFDG